MRVDGAFLHAVALSNAWASTVYPMVDGGRSGHGVQGWIATLIGLLVGLILGVWTATSIASCAGSNACTVSWDGVSALGTWVGGLGTVVAVLVAARTFQHQQNLAEREANVQRAEALQASRALAEDAARVAVRVRPLSSSAGVLDSVLLSVENGSHGRTIFDVSVEADWLAQPWKLAVMKAKDDRTQTVGMEEKGISMESSQRHVTEMRRTAVISFVMDGMKWRRIGDAPPETLK